MQRIFESMPIILACYSSIICAKQYVLDRRKHNRRVLLLGVICSILLIIAQTSWYVTYVVNGNLVGTGFANQIWAVFNSLTMIAFIVLAHGSVPNVEKPTSSRN